MKIMNFVDKIPVEVFMIVGFLLGCLIVELDFRFSPYWKEFRKKKT